MHHFCCSNDKNNVLRSLFVSVWTLVAVLDHPVRVKVTGGTTTRDKGYLGSCGFVEASWS